MRKVLTKKVNEAAFGRSRRKTFEAAVRVVAACVGARRIHVTPISAFSRHHFAVLKRIRAGSVEVVTHRGEPFVILGMRQVLSLVADQSVGRAAAAEIPVGLPAIPASPAISKHRSVQTRRHRRLQRLST